MEPEGKRDKAHKLVFGHIRIDIARKITATIPMAISQLCFNFYHFPGWEWADTCLATADANGYDTFLAADVKRLLMTRGERKQSIKGNKVDMIEYLKEKHEVELKVELIEYEDLTVMELMCELRLRNLDVTPDRKVILIQRLRGEINGTSK